MNENRTFEDTYLYYLNRLDNLSFETASAVSDIQLTKGALSVPLFNRRYAVSARGILDKEGSRPEVESRLDAETIAILGRRLFLHLAAKTGNENRVPKET